MAASAARREGLPAQSFTGTGPHVFEAEGLKDGKNWMDGLNSMYCNSTR